MLLHLSTWPEIEARLKVSTAIVVPIGSNEQHGPTGLLGTDWLCPEIIAHEAQKDADLLVAPTFNIGMAQHHLDFPGTIALSEIYAAASYEGRRAGFACRLKNWWDLHGVMRLAQQQFPSGHGSHATPSEIAITQWAYPDHIKAANYAPQIAPTGPIREAADFRARFADGRMGSDPGLATPEKGGELVKLAAVGLAEAVREFEGEAVV